MFLPQIDTPGTKKGPSMNLTIPNRSPNRHQGLTAEAAVSHVQKPEHTSCETQSLKSEGAKKHA